MLKNTVILYLQLIEETGNTHGDKTRNRVQTTEL